MGQTAPSCADPTQLKAVENPKVSIVPDPKTAWQPRGGTVGFTVSGNNVSLDGVKVIVCFGWPADNWKDTVRLGGAVVTCQVRHQLRDLQCRRPRPGLGACVLDVPYRAVDGSVRDHADNGLRGRGESHGGRPDLHRDHLPTAGVAAGCFGGGAIAFAVFYAFGSDRGVPGKGLVLWMISTRNGVASLSQAQIVLWTFLIGAASPARRR
jgi:hypothetical protein